jgi:sRNA-binding regulator protein Hfq
MREADSVPSKMVDGVMQSRISGTIRAPKSSSKTKIVPKGHEAFLKALEASNATVAFEKVSSGERFTGTIKHSDKYTVSVLSDGRTRVIFKHDISEFEPQFAERTQSVGG